jgi:lysophospholipase L1-like esterase
MREAPPRAEITSARPPLAEARAAVVAALPRWKLVLYSLTPALLLLFGAEAVVRIGGLDTPTVKTARLPEETVGLLRLDPDLFWSLRPGLRVVSQGATVVTNDLGLRTRAVGPRQPGELRILSLGESTTFGATVENAETYTAVLGDRLGEQLPGRMVTAINAGVSSYTSFQSLKYLELRGLELRPDLVLFYHEVNDYLPATVRDASNNEIGATSTDRQLWESRTDRLRRLVVRSALYRYVTFRLARQRLRSIERAHVRNPIADIGLPALGIPGRLYVRAGDREVSVKLNEMALGQRVSEEERLQNLRELAALCKRHGVALVVIHPSYRDSSRHECLLTRFCRETGTPMYEADDSLHPAEMPHHPLFRDSWHPNADGHRRLGEDLAAFIVRQNLLAAAPPR